MAFATLAFRAALDTDDCDRCLEHVDVCNALGKCPVSSTALERKRADTTEYLDGWDHGTELADDMRDRAEVMS